MNACCWFLTIALGAAEAAPQFDVQPLEGPTATGVVTSLDARQIVVQTAGKPTSFEIDRVVCVSAHGARPVAKSEAAAWIELTDGSRIATGDYGSQGERARAIGPGEDPLEFPTRIVANVRLQQARGAIATEWSRIQGLKLPNDLLVVAKGDSIEYHKGVLHGVNDKTVAFEVDGETINVKRAKVFGLIYRHADETPGEPACWIADASGSRWAAQSAALDDGKLRFTAGGIKLSRPLGEIVQIDLSRGKIVYLSQLRPDLVAYTPYFAMDRNLPARDAFFRPRTDQNLESKPLQLGGTTYRHGLALHSRTEVVYRLNDRFSRLKAIAGIDDDVRPLGNVRLIVRGDDKTLLDTTVSGSAAPRPIDVDIAGVRRLTIVADFSGDVDVAGHLDLANVRIVK